MVQAIGTPAASYSAHIASIATANSAPAIAASWRKRRGRPTWSFRPSIRASG